MATEQVWRWHHVEEQAFPDLASFIRLVNERMKRLDVQKIRATVGTSGGITTGPGSPEGVVTAGPGQLYGQTDAGADHPGWVKHSGVGNTGWRRWFEGAGTDSVRIGRTALSSALEGVAIGFGASVTSVTAQGIAIGKSALAGDNTVSAASGPISIGEGSTARATGSIAIGASANVGAATYTDAIAIGSTAQPQTANAIAIGANAQASGTAAIAIGRSALAGSPNQLVLGASGSIGITNVRYGDEQIATPAEMIHYIVSGNGTNNAGAAWTFRGSRGTGNAVPGVIRFQTSTPGGSGAALQAWTTRLTIAHDVITMTLPVDITGGTQELRMGGTKVLAARVTGWALPTGTLSRATFDESTVTLAQLAQRVAALITDFYNSHGAIGA